MSVASARIEHLRASFPQEGLFRDKEWRLSPHVFQVGEDIAHLILALGPALRAFQRACNNLYFQGLEDAELAWVPRLLDQGKPANIVALGRHERWREELPAVLRPDLVLTDTGLCITELDSVPGGIGLTGWLGQTYATLGDAVVGGPDGMVRGFDAAFPRQHILVSRESADYQPEMEWLATQLTALTGRPRAVMNPWNLTEDELRGGEYYRFFELFDLDQVEHGQALLRLAAAGEAGVTAPPKAFLEEKLWLALFHSPALADWWAAALDEAHHQLLMRCIPRGWVVDPAALPAHAVLPGLEVHDWAEVAHFGGKRRELVLKVSGFSELAWGSRSVSMGHDLSLEQWAAALKEALGAFPEHPYVLQEFHRGRLVEHPVWDEQRAEALPMRSRVRLCPYWFVPEGQEQTCLGGVLATVCPADKKILHGMRDAMMLPVGFPANLVHGELTS